MQPKLKKKKVLIADDAHETRRSTRLMLSMVEEVEVAAIALDGTQAIEMAQQRKPDIVILDLNMPRVNGLAAYKKIVAENPHTACIIISAEKTPNPYRPRWTWVLNITSSNPSLQTSWKMQ